MMEVLQSVIAFVVVLGILITFHEFGHFWVARKCDVKILRFSVGFGKPIWKRTFGADESEFVIASLPLGGYVKMLDEREGHVDRNEHARAFNNKTLFQRIAIVAAGPLFNFLLAIAAYWIMFLIGVSGLKPRIGDIDPVSIAANAGFKTQDLIVKVDGVETPTWTAVVDTTVNNVVSASEVDFTVLRGSSERQISLDLSQVAIDDMASGKLFSAIGLYPSRPLMPAVIGEVLPGGVAEKIGLQTGDKVLRVDANPIGDWGEWVQIIRDNPDKDLHVDIERKNETVSVLMRPAVVNENGKQIGRIGAGLHERYVNDTSHIAIESYPVIPAFFKASEKTLDVSLLTLRVLGKMIVGEASVKNLSGPISIAQYAGKTAELGLAAFLSFMAIISVSLGVLNLLPIPLLDGGHLLYYLIELIKGSPVTESFQIAGQQVGLVLLLGLMSIALYNDILRLVG